MIIQPSRRKFITGLSALFVAPAIVKASSLMPVKVIEDSIINGGSNWVPYDPRVQHVIKWVEYTFIEEQGRLVFRKADDHTSLPIPIDERDAPWLENISIAIST